MAVRTIEQLKTTIQANADKVQINSISPQDVFDTMNDVVDTLNQRAKWANFRCDLLYSKNFAPLTPTGDTDINRKTYDYCGILSPKSYYDTNEATPSLGTYYHQFNTLDLYARISGFPAEEDPTKYGIAIYRRSLRTFKGGAGSKVPRLNRFSRGVYTSFEPSLRPLGGIYNENFTRTYKKMVGLKLNGDGWNGQDPEQPSTNWVVPKKISELNQGKYEPLWAMQCGNGDGYGDDVSLNIIRGSLLKVYLFGKKVAQKPIKMYTYPTTPQPEDQVRVRFVKVKLPIDIRLVHEITPGVDETIKILWSGNLVIRTMVPFSWDGLLNEWAVSDDHWDATDSEGNYCNRRYSVDIE